MTTTWINIYNTLVSLIPKLDEKHEYVDLLDNDLMPVAQQMGILRLESPYAAQIDATVAEWKIGKPFRKLSPEAERWLGIRVETAARFALLHTMPGNIVATSMLGSVQCSEEDMVKFLLSTWWRNHGFGQYYLSYMVENSP